jgi:hypothetical protein
MMKPAIFLVVIKDVVDFLIISLTTFLFTLGIYYILPHFKSVDLSFYFFEQFLELFFVNPSLVTWFLGLGLGVTLIYYLFSIMLFQTTVGGLLVGIALIDTRSQKPIGRLHAIVMAVGAYSGALLFFFSPLFAWWLAEDHRGWSEKWARASFGKIRRGHE